MTSPLPPNPAHSSGVHRRIPALVLCMLVPYVAIGCCKRETAETATRSEAARAWLRDWPAKYDWTEISNWQNVTDTRMPQAELLLRDKGFLQLTEAQASDLIGSAVSFQKPARGADPYLLRGVGAVNGRFPLMVFIRQNGDVWVGGEAISKCPVPIERRAVVAWLPQPPREAYATFIVGK